ncbi:hypothetical protein ACWGNZ_00885 [Sphingomonas zeae]
MKPFSDKSERERIAALSASVDVLDGRIVAIAEKRADAQRRRAALQSRAAADPAPIPEVDAATDELAARLAADPAAVIGAGDANHLSASRNAAAVQAHAASGVAAALAAALRAVDAEVGGLDAEAANLQAERAAAWATFACGAHDALAAELRRRWAAISEDVITPMLELTALRGPDGTGIVTGNQARLTADSSLCLAGPGLERLYLLAGQGTGGVRTRNPAAITELRAALTL